MTTTHLDTASTEAAPTPVPGRSRWPAVALAGICLLAGLLYLWGIGDTWGNAYYSAAVKSMSQSFENFFFGAFDPAGVVTVDKPPMALWLQTLSVMTFGFTRFAVLFPQALAGVATVFLLHRTVRRWAGEHAALLAALIMALTPITVAINRDNNPDTLLVLLVVAAAYAMTRAIDVDRSSRATAWVLLAAFLVGCGFLTKMLQAWMVLPAFVVAYLIGRRASWGRRLVDLAVAAVVLIVSSFWWVAATALWPAPKPYIGGSTDGTAWDLVFGYNGFGRIFGGERNMSGGMPPDVGGAPTGMPALPPGGPGGGGGFSGQAGILRLFNEQLGGQISWLLPLCLMVLASMIVVGVRRWRGGTSVDRRRAAGWALWGGWLVLIGLMFSLAQGTMHPYYTTMLAPAVGAVVGAGIVQFWRWYRQPHGKVWLLLPIGVVVTVVWAVILVARNLDWNGWVAYVAAALGALAGAALLIARRRASVAKAALSLGLTAILLVPSAWSAITAFGAQSAMGGVNPMAGPSSGFGGPGGQRPGGSPRGDANAPMPLRISGAGGPGGESLSAEQRRLLDYVAAQAADRDIPLAVEGGSMSASSLVLNSDLTVVGMGGFTGSDDAPSVQQLTEWKQSGVLGFVLLGGGPGPGGDGRRADDRGVRNQGSPGTNSARSDWVQRSCALVVPATYGGSDDSQQLYDCRQ